MNTTKDNLKSAPGFGSDFEHRPRGRRTGRNQLLEVRAPRKRGALFLLLSHLVDSAGVFTVTLFETAVLKKIGAGFRSFGQRKNTINQLF